jgi:hypothetical protein
MGMLTSAEKKLDKVVALLEEIVEQGKKEYTYTYADGTVVKGKLDLNAEVK